MALNLGSSPLDTLRDIALLYVRFHATVKRQLACGGFSRLQAPRNRKVRRCMRFEILGRIENIETFAAGKGIRELRRLQKAYGKGRWRKRKGNARVRLPDGAIRFAELHWYEASGIGKKEYKIKRYLE